jgi:hypothetical protein
MNTINTNTNEGLIMFKDMKFTSKNTNMSSISTKISRDRKCLSWDTILINNRPNIRTTNSALEESVDHAQYRHVKVEKISTDVIGEENILL